MNIALVLTAIKLGATAVNHCALTDLHTADTTGRLSGGMLTDELTGEQFPVRAKGVINATGPLSDTLLAQAHHSSSAAPYTPVVQPSSGIHIALPAYFAPRTMGLIDPATSDGRVVFFLPWEGATIAGTTDAPAPLPAPATPEPRASEDDIAWVLAEVRKFVDGAKVSVRREDVLSAWSGLRPLVRDPSHAGGGETQGLVRSHVVHVHPATGLLTVAGGKWTTYRRMAADAVDAAVAAFGLAPVEGGSRTEELQLVGSEGWGAEMWMGLVQRYALPEDVAQHLAGAYGARAWELCDAYLDVRGGRERLAPGHPYIRAEVPWAVTHEYAASVPDVLGRRMRLAFVDAAETGRVLGEVGGVLGGMLGWGRGEVRREVARGRVWLREMGLEGGEPEPEPEREGWGEWVGRWVRWW